MLSYGVRGEEAADVLFDDVVTEHDTDLVAVREVLGKQQRVGDTALTFLIRVLEVAEAQVFAVAQELEEVARMLATCHDHDLANARVHEALDRVIDHRPVVDREQVLVRDERERPQTRTEPAGEDDTFHDWLQMESRGRTMEVAFGFWLLVFDFWYLVFDF